MPGSRCVVFGCNNTRDDKGGISIHSCPADKCLRAKWVTFVQLHRKDFFRKGSFPVCSAHFSPTAFQRAIHIKGQQRNLIKGAGPYYFQAEADIVANIAEKPQKSKLRVYTFYSFSVTLTGQLIFPCDSSSQFFGGTARTQLGRVKVFAKDFF